MFKKILAILLILGMLMPVGIVMAGNGPGGGGRPTATPIPPTQPPVPTETPDTGSLYGDLYVILRDVDGLPILDEHGCIQPISAVSATTTLPDGAVVTAIAGEPFTLGTYIDSEGVLIECELTTDMATWVQAVDFGRLNLGRAPEGVIAHAFDEAVNKMNSALALGIDPAGRIMYTLDNITWSTIDAPAENLALYIKMMVDGDWITTDVTPVEPGGKGGGKGGSGGGQTPEDRPVLNASAIALLNTLGFTNLGYAANTSADLNSYHLTLAASLLAGAADKGGTITLDKVIYINSIYGINQPGTLIDAKGNKYFDFGGYTYQRSLFAGRNSGACNLGWVWVLQPEADTDSNPVTQHFITKCMEILGYENAGHNADINSVRFTDMTEMYTTVDPDYLVFDSNVRGFAQASDDALQVLEYIHNYKIPEVLYPAP